MPYAYLLTPFLAWLVCGCVKFLVNCLRERRLAFDLIGYGGLPSNHSAIVASICALVAVRQGLDSPALGVAVALGFIVLLDAASLRRQVGRHAVALNRLDPAAAPLRERMGHTKLEIASGLVVGAIVGLAVAAI